MKIIIISILCILIFIGILHKFIKNKNNIRVGGRNCSCRRNSCQK